MIDLPRPANSPLSPRVPLSLALARPVPCLHATLLEGGTARSGDLVVQAERPVSALCCALVDAGQPDCALVVRWWDLAPAEFVLSIHRAAADERAFVAQRRPSRGRPSRRVPASGAGPPAAMD